MAVALRLASALGAAAAAAAVAADAGAAIVVAAAGASPPRICAAINWPRPSCAVVATIVDLAAVAQELRQSAVGWCAGPGLPVRSHSR